MAASPRIQPSDPRFSMPPPVKSRV